MQASTNALLSAVSKDDPNDFIATIHSQNRTCPNIDLTDVLPRLNESEHKTLWQKLQILFKKYSKVHLTGNSSTKDSKIEKNTATKVLDCTVSLISLYIEQNKPTIFEELTNVVADMHGCILVWPSELDKLKFRIVQLGENWYKMGFPRKTTFAMHVFLFLLRCTTSAKARKSDVKRLWNTRNCLGTLNVNVANMAEYKNLLITAVTTPIFLNCDEGIKFLISLFELNQEFIKELHTAIKTKLPSCNFQQSETYGNVYFKAWKSAKTFKEKIEVDCIQDLMFSAIHINPTSSRTLINNLRKLLSYIHSQKETQPDVREMLLRLYEPFLWRSLKVANGYVRANATVLFFDAFPLEDAKKSNEERESLLAMQYELTRTLLMDDYPVVQMYAVSGVCQIFNFYWEIIPSDIIANMLSVITKQHVYDSTSADTRMTVFTGLSWLVQNPLSQPLLQKLLPKLGSSIHDPSEKVRLSVVDLLHKVKNQCSIKYWDIVPPEQLLACLEVDTDRVCRKIVSLLFSSYHPVGKSDMDILHRSMILIRENRNASRKFYQHAHKCMGVNDSVRFLILATRFAHYYANKLRTGEKSSDDSVIDQETSVETEIANNADFPTTDFNVICGLLDAVCILWTGIHSQLKIEHNATVQKNLIRQVSKAMRLFNLAYKGTAAFQAVLGIASLMPENKVHQISGHCISCLKSMTCNSPVSEYGIILTSLFNWGMSDTVLELVLEWISSALPIDVSFGKPRNRKVKFCEPRKPQPMLALKFLQHMLKMPQCRKEMLTKCRDELISIVNAAKKTMSFLENRFSTRQFQCETPDEFLVNMFESYCQLSVHLHTQDDIGEFSTVETMKDVYLWVEKIALPHLLPGTNENGRLKRKRKMSDANAFDKLKVAFDLLQIVLKVAHDMFLCCVASEEFAAHSLYLCNKILEKEKGYVLAVEVTKLLCQLLRYSLAYKIEPSLYLSELPETLYTALKAMLKYTCNKYDQAIEIVPELKLVFRAIFTSYLNVQRFHSMQTFMANVFTTVMSEISFQVNKEEDSLKLYKDVNHLPVLSSTLLNAIIRNKDLIKIFFTAVVKFLSTSTDEDIVNYIAIGQILLALQKEAEMASVDLKVAVTTLEKQVSDMEKNDTCDVARLEDAKRVVEELKTKR